MSDKVGGQMGERNRKKVEIVRVDNRIEKKKYEKWGRGGEKIETENFRVMGIPTPRNILPAAIYSMIR